MTGDSHSHRQVCPHVRSGPLLFHSMDDMNGVSWPVLLIGVSQPGTPAAVRAHQCKLRHQIRLMSVPHVTGDFQQPALHSRRLSHASAAAKGALSFW